MKAKPNTEIMKRSIIFGLQETYSELKKVQHKLIDRYGIYDDGTMYVLGDVEPLQTRIKELNAELTRLYGLLKSLE